MYKRQEAFWIRHLPALKKMQELIREGVIGQVGFARCDYGFVAGGARKARKFDSGLGGGALLDVGIYNLGFLRMVMGDVPPEHFTSEHHLNEFGTDDYSTILLRYPGGARAAATASIGMDMPRAVSYTHLDVYKRQGPGTANEGAAEASGRRMCGFCRCGDRRIHGTRCHV